MRDGQFPAHTIPHGLPELRREGGGQDIAKNPNCSASEDDVIRTWYPEYGIKWDRWDVLLPSRTRRAIQNRAQKLGIRCRYRGPKSWRKSEDRAAVAALAEVCRMTGRTPEAVIRRLDHLVHEMRKKRREQNWISG